MTNNTQEYFVSYSKKDGFQVTLYKGSTFRNFILSISETMCVLTRHHFCRFFGGDAIKWDDRKREEIVTLSITKEQAKALSRPDAWDWLEDVTS